MKHFLVGLVAMLCVASYGQTKSLVTPRATTSADNAVPRYDGTSGQLIQNSGVTISDANALTAATLNASGLTASRAVATDGSKNLVSSAATAAEQDFLSGVTSAIQTQLNAKGDFVGPASSTDNAIVRFDGITGKLGKNSIWTLGDTGSLTAGDASQASSTITFNLSGASDPVLTAANGSIANSVQWYAPAGSGAAPGYAFSSSTNTGFVNSSGTIIDIYHGAVATTRMSSTVATFNALGIHGGNVNVPLVWLEEEGTGILQMYPDAATATAQVIKAHDGLGTDKAGASLTLSGGKSTGSAIGGARIDETSLTGSTGSSLNSYSTRRYIYAGEKTLTESSATIVLNIALGSSKYLGGRLLATTHADDATDFQAITDEFTFSAVNKAGTVTATIQATPSTSTTAASAGTLATTWTAVANAATVDLKNSAVSSLTQTTLKVKWQLELNSDDVGTVTP